MIHLFLSLYFLAQYLSKNFEKHFNFLIVKILFLRIFSKNSQKNYPWPGV